MKDERFAAADGDGASEAGACRACDEARSAPGSAARRRMVGAAIGVGIAAPMIGGAGTARAKAPRDMRPAAGDDLVFRFGDKEGQPVKLDDVSVGGDLIQAMAREPASGIVRDGSRLNGINIVRVDPAALEKDVAENALEGVIAFSSVCTHQGCDLTQWVPDTNTFKCFCHHSEFLAVDGGSVVHGPARRSLAMLPLEKAEDGALRVRAPFQGKVGFKKK